MKIRALANPIPLVAIPLALAIFLAPALLAEAQIVPPECRLPSNIAATCTLCHLAILVINLTDFLVEKIALPVAAVLFAVGGIVLLLSGPSETRRTMGKKIILNTLIGLVIVLLAWIAVDTIIKVLTQGQTSLAWWTANFGTWNEINPTPCEI